MDIKLRLFEFETIHDALITAVKTFIDPKTLPDPEDPDAPAATSLFGDNVRKTRPKTISLYGGQMGLVTLEEVPTTSPEEIGEDEIAVLKGALLPWIQGRTEKAQGKCEHYCDVAGAYFKNQDLLGIPGVTIERVQRNPYRWININLAGDGKTPVFYTLGYVGFNVNVPLNDTLYIIPSE